MIKWFSRILSLLIAAFLIAGATDFGTNISNETEIHRGSFLFLLGLPLIWFPNQLGEFTGYVGRGGQIDTQTPAWLVAGAGWFLLVGVPVLLLILN